MPLLNKHPSVKNPKQTKELKNKRNIEKNIHAHR
jgi:hypothetical protein